MATVKLELDVWSDVPPASAYPTKDVIAGSNFPVKCLDFDAAADESTYYVFNALSYGSGDITVRLQWYADTGSSGNVVWGAALAAITPNTDTTDIETKAFGTVATTQDTHLGTTNQRLHEAVVTISSLDSVASGDWCVLRVYRDADGTAATDDMTGDACLVGLVLEWSDT